MWLLLNLSLDHLKPSCRNCSDFNIISDLIKSVTIILFFNFKFMYEYSFFETIFFYDFHERSWRFWRLSGSYGGGCYSLNSIFHIPFCWLSGLTETSNLVYWHTTYQTTRTSNTNNNKRSNYFDKRNFVWIQDCKNRLYQFPVNRELNESFYKKSVWNGKNCLNGHGPQ